MKAAAVAIIGLALLWFWNRNRPLTGTVTTSEGYDLEPYGGPTSYPQPIINTAQAIARAEGYYITGSVPNRANNPGDLKLGGTTIANGITVFDSPDSGWNALYRQLYLILTGRSSYYNLDMSITEMGRIWTATVAEQSAWSNNVAGSLGVPASTPLWAVLS